MRGVRYAIAAVCLVVVTLLATGCATAQKQAEERQRLRKANSHLDIGIGYLESERAALALREFLVAEKLDPRNARVQYALGEAYLAQGKLDECEIHLKRALELFPDYHDARLSLSALYLMRERYAETVEQCDLLVADPTFQGPYRALANRGLAQLNMGRSAEARKSLELALDYNAQYWPALLTLATLEAEQGHRLEAIGLLQQILELEPGPRVESEVNYRLAEIYISLGKRQRAIGHLSTSVTRAPEGPWAAKSQEYLKLLR
jgi:type IV pilus assembly protein PilF